MDKIKKPGNKQVYGPYSPIRKAGNMYFVSGQVGVDPATKTASTDITEQTDQVLLNLKKTLISAGLSMKDVVKTTVFVTNIADFPAVNAVYETHFPDLKPARSTAGVKEFPRVAGDIPILVEIEAIAVKD